MGTGLPLRKRLAGGVTKRQQGHAVGGFGPCHDDEITLDSRSEGLLKMVSRFHRRERHPIASEAGFRCMG